jgi:ABC-type bacteriocin/lantibiotic exporter with double-glycine peptidase domain
MFGRVVRTSMLWLGACGVLLAAGPGVWLDVPFVKQENDGCGAASIAMVMQYWQRQQNEPASQDSDPAEIQRALYSPKAHGIYASDMQSYFAQKGFRTFTIRAEWEDLKHHLDKGRPLIVALQSAGGAPLHYIVVAGLDGEQGFIMVNDPAQRKLLKQDRQGFEREWGAAGNWTLLALPQTDAH